MAEEAADFSSFHWSEKNITITITHFYNDIKYGEQVKILNNITGYFRPTVTNQMSWTLYSNSKALKLRRIINLDKGFKEFFTRANRN